MSEIERSSADGLHRLQKLQRRFDRERGFIDLGLERRPDHEPQAVKSIRLPVQKNLSLGQSPPDDEDLRRIEFATIALCGEVGELANAIKKARRARALGQDPLPRLVEAREEAPDILAYLLKVTNALGCDLEELYLEKMSDNYLRFPAEQATASGPRILTIAGPSGVGKTTIANALAGEFATYLEIVDTNPYLPKLLNGDPNFDATANQDWFMSQHENYIRLATLSKSQVIDQDPVAIVRVYCRLFREQERIKQAEYVKFLLRLLDLESNMTQWPGGRVILFLDAPSEVLHERLLKRQYPIAPSVEWLENTRSHFARLAAIVPSAKTISTSDQGIDAVTAFARHLLTG